MWSTKRGAQASIKPQHGGENEIGGEKRKRLNRIYQESQRGKNKEAGRNGREQRGVVSPRDGSEKGKVTKEGFHLDGGATRMKYSRKHQKKKD